MINFLLCYRIKHCRPQTSNPTAATPVARLLIAMAVFLGTAFLSQTVYAAESPHSPFLPAPLDGDVVFESPSGSDARSASLLLPDLRTLPPTDLQLQIFHGTETRRLRFSNTIWNSGPGDVELHGTRAPGTGNVLVEQLILRDDGTSLTRDTGVFYYNVEHGHWHWEGFAIYEVWSMTPTGQLDQRLAISDKVGYCLIDIETYWDFTGGDLPDYIDPPSPRQYTGCSTTRQGLSVGWTDTYKDHLPGQHVDISHLPDGVYVLRSIVDPQGILLELDETNNAAILYFGIAGDQLEVLDSLDIPTDPAYTPQ